MHVEAFVRDDLWEDVKDLVNKNFTWFVITPANFEYCQSYFNLKMNKEEFTQKLIERIKYLQDNNEEIQLHLHLSAVVKFIDKELQDTKFNEAISFMNSLGITPKKMAPGWCKYNQYTLELSKRYGIKYIYVFDPDPLKKPIIKNGVIIVPSHKFWHDYDFA
ncbi:MAG: hypothetical protein GF353_16395 [Candidatus Lokiarchaeota archaeon]|nr:hypothetical protein [Candidatus Lokiarchaeota archaeon]